MSARPRGTICRRVALVVTLVFAVLPCLPVTADQGPFVQRSEEELLLFALHLGPWTLAESLTAFPARDGSGILLPLGEVARLLTLAIEVDVADGTAHGFIITESRQFSLNARAGRATIAGEDTSFDRTRVEVHQDDIYVESSLLSRWLPVDFAIDPYISTVTVLPREPLPLQQRREREQRMQQVRANAPVRDENVPRIDSPYNAASWPFADLSLRGVLRSGDGESDTQFQHSTFLSGDVLGALAEIFILGSDSDPFGETRATLSRRDPAANLLGGLHAREIAIGEVFDPGTNLVSFASSGPGFLLSSYPLRQPTQFDRYTLTGDLPVGWEVELYQNSALVGYEQPRADGRYEFRDVPLLFGLNVFRLVFYGPQGQTREEITRYNVGETLAPPGELRYRLVGDDARGLSRRGAMQLDYGLNRRMSLRGALSRLEFLDGDAHTYATGGIAAYWREVFAEVGFARDLSGGSAAQVGLQTRFGPFSLTGQVSDLYGYRSELFQPLFGEIKRRYEVRTDAIVAVRRVASLVAGLQLRRDELRDGGTAYNVVLPISAQFGRTFVSHRLTSVFGKDVAQLPDDVTLGSLLLSRSVRGTRLRAELNYYLRSNEPLNTVALTAETFAIPNYNFQFGIQRAIVSDTTTYSAGVNRFDGSFGYGATSSYVEGGGFTVSANVFVGVARDVAGGWHASARAVAASGAATARVFLDADGDGIWDPEERPIENAGFFLDRSSVRTLTSADGTAWISPIPAYVEHDLRLSRSTLDDALMLAVRPAVRFTTRPGDIVKIDFAVIVTGEITGTVWASDATGVREAPRVRLQLVDSEGNVAAETVSAYDGFYEMTGIRPGSYVLRIASTKVLGRELREAPRKEIAIAAAGSVLEGVDLRIVLAESAQ